MRFCGRVDELDELISRWKLASDIAAPAPQLVILKAERGVGKTRLALEFYRWLSEHVDAKGPDGYWPDSSGILDRSSDVNPDPYACRYDQSLPFLWWGIRAADPGTENRISGDAIASYDRFLAPHLVALTVKARAIKSGKALLSVWRDVAKGEAASWSGYDTVMSVGEGLFKTVQILRGTLEQTRTSALGEINKKSINRVDTILEDLETVLNTRSLGFAKTPAVILIDDAQFTSEDPGLADFCEKLLHMAMTQRWPLMVIVTHWKRDLSPEFMPTECSFAGVLHHARTRPPHENGPVAGLPGGYLTDKNTVEIDLAPVPDLSDALTEAQPGLLPDQAAALLNHAGGNPRHLEQIIAFLRENEEFFEDFDTANALTEDGLREALEETQDIFKVVMRRLRDAPVDVQEAICLASLQGMRFVSAIVNDLAKACLSGDRSAALKEASDPFSMVSARHKASIAEFSERLFYVVAEKRRRSLKGLSDTAALTTALQDILLERIRDIDVEAVDDVDGSVMTLGLAAEAFANSLPAVALIALEMVIKIEQKRYAYTAAVAVADRFYKLFLSTPPESRALDIWAISAVTDLFIAEGENEKALTVLEGSLDRARSAAQDQTPENLRYLAAALNKTGRAASASGDLKGAMAAWREGLSIARNLEIRMKTSESRNNLAIMLDDTAEAFFASGDLAQASKHWHESLEIRRETAALSQTVENLRAVSVSLINNGDVARSAGDLPAAAIAWKECLEIRRDLVTQLQSPESLRDLSIALTKVGDAAMVVGELSSSASHWQEALLISRDLVERMGTSESLRDLSIVLTKIGDASEAAGDMTKTAAAWQEALDIRRSLAERLKTPSSKNDLAAALSKVGKGAMSMGDPHTAAAVWQEGLSVARDLATTFMTPGYMRSFSLALINTGDAALALEDVESARIAWHQASDIQHDLVTRLKTHESFNDLATTLNRLGHAAMKADDFESARSAWQQGLEISRALSVYLQTPGSLRSLAVSLNMVGDAAMKLGDPLAAVEAWQEGLEITRSLAEDLQTPQSYHDLIAALDRFRDVAVEIDDLEAAVMACREVVEISHELATRLGTPDSQWNYCVSLHSLAVTLIETGHPSEAQSFIDKGMDYAKTLQPKVREQATAVFAELLTE